MKYQRNYLHSVIRNFQFPVAKWCSLYYCIISLCGHWIAIIMTLGILPLNYYHNYYDYLFFFFIVVNLRIITALVTLSNIICNNSKRTDIYIFYLGWFMLSLAPLRTFSNPLFVYFQKFLFWNKWIILFNIFYIHYVRCNHKTKNA